MCQHLHTFWKIFLFELDMELTSCMVEGLADTWVHYRSHLLACQTIADEIRPGYESLKIPSTGQILDDCYLATQETNCEKL